MNKTEKQIINKLRLQVRSKSQRCYNPGCTNEAIRSHILQRNGILNKIADKNGYVYQLERTDLYRNTTYQLKYSSIAGGDVLTFWGFCKSCDYSIFKEVELQVPDFDSYRHNLLFSYRALLKELYKIQYNLKYFKAIQSCKSISITTKESYEENIFRHEFVEKIDLNLKHLMESELQFETKEHTFHFSKYVLPNLHVATSAIYTPPQIELFNPSSLSSDYMDAFFNRSRVIVFFHLIPVDSGTIFILGHHKNSSRADSLVFSEFNDKSKIEALLSETLIKRIETWCISTSLFVKLKERGLDTRILQLKEENLGSMKLNKIDFNLFEVL